MSTPLYSKRILRPRRRYVGKWELGHVLVIAGSRRYSGAAILVAEAALRTGAGLVTMAYPETITNPLRRTLPEAIHLPLPATRQGTVGRGAYSIIRKYQEKVSVVVCGSGLTRHRQTALFVRRCVEGIKRPILIDADGLNVLAERSDFKKMIKQRQAITVLTPHEGELARLSRFTKTKIHSQRRQLARHYAKMWRVYLVLKGYNTIIASPDGRLMVNKTGGPGLATAGTGDVLSGVIGAFLAEYPLLPMEAIATAVYCHGLAGDAATRRLGERSVIASDVIAQLPLVFKKIK